MPVIVHRRLQSDFIICYDRYTKTHVTSGQVRLSNYNIGLNAPKTFNTAVLKFMFSKWYSYYITKITYQT